MPHPILKVYGWQKRLEEEKERMKAQITEQEGLKKARMTQMFSLMHLPTDAQNHLSDDYSNSHRGLQCASVNGSHENAFIAKK